MGRCVILWCYLDLCFDLAVVTLKFKILLGTISQKLQGVQDIYLVGALVGGCAMSWFDFDLISDLAVVTLTFKMLSWLCL